MTDVPVFQVRKVFDPKTMSVVEQLVQTGIVSKPEELAETTEVVASVEPVPVDIVKESIVEKVKRRRKKKSGA